MDNNGYYGAPQYAQQPQLRDGGLVRAQNEQVVWQYPVAPGYYVTFFVEATMKVFRKACLSQFEPPMIKEYDLVEKQQQAPQPPQPQQEKDAMARIAALEDAVRKLNERGGKDDAEPA